MSYDQNIYNSPENFDAEVIAVLDESNLSYEFNMIVVWKKGPYLYWAQDSGCSCPVPFENYARIEDTICLNSPAAVRDFENCVDNFNATMIERDTFKETVHKILYLPNDILKGVIYGLDQK